MEVVLWVILSGFLAFKAHLSFNDNIKPDLFSKTVSEKSYHIAVRHRLGLLVATH
jgi:hypothetical protein